MSSRTLHLRGWKAVAFVAVVLALAGLRFVRARTALDTQGREALEAWIVGELQRPLLADTTLPLAEKGQALLGASAVTLRALSAHGPPDDTVVRVELEPSASLPAGTELVRYYRLRYSSLTGWSHREPASALTYYLGWF